MKLELDIPDEIAPEIAMQAAAQAVAAGKTEQISRGEADKSRAGLRRAFWRALATACEAAKNVA